MHWLLSVCLFASLEAQVYEVDFAPQHHAQFTPGIIIHDVKRVGFEKKNSIGFHGISALAYSKQYGLYALGDRGGLYHLGLTLEDAKIKTLTLLDAMPLRNKKGKVLDHNDAEGMVFDEDTLLISFERKPRILRFDLQGKKLNAMPLNPVLKDIENYTSKNKALEALVWTKKYGLITAPENPLKHTSQHLHTLYALEHRWTFKAMESLVAMDVLPDGTLLTLERRFEYWKGYHIVLRQIDLAHCPNGLCEARLLASLKSEDGWELDNFEGLCHLYDGFYLMVSDDNDNPWQETLLVLFELTSID